jgi:hypothetical protein
MYRTHYIPTFAQKFLIPSHKNVIKTAPRNHDLSYLNGDSSYNRLMYVHVLVEIGLHATRLRILKYFTNF